MPPLAGAQNAAAASEPAGAAVGIGVQAEVDELGGHAVTRRLPGVGIVIGERDRAGAAHGRGNAAPVKAKSRASQRLNVNRSVRTVKPGTRGQLMGQPVHVGGVTTAARVAGAELDQLVLPQPHFGQAGHARDRTTGRRAHPCSSFGLALRANSLRDNDRRCRRTTGPAAG